MAARQVEWSTSAPRAAPTRSTDPAWEYNRLSAYTANTYDNDANGIPKGTYTRNQFGFTFGGPAIKNKLFFFGSAEWLRVRSNASLLGYVPTPQFIASTPQNVQDYFSKYGANLPFISTVSKADLVSRYALGGSFDTAIPNPATPIFGLVNYFAPSDAGGDSPQNTYDLVARADYTYSDKTQYSFRYGRESLFQLPGSIFNSPYPQYNVGFNLVNDTYLGTANHNFTQNLIEQYARWLLPRLHGESVRHRTGRHPDVVPVQRRQFGWAAGNAAGLL